ncbi:hypothetical protein [Clostridium sulfidigenes]|uniref:hypothetical protein n=1 Tax=Clostridium sulfidigenes TaxID=318464 RepID=UPI003F8934D3
MTNLDYKETVRGYHGTFESVVKDIIDSGFKTKIRKDHWLGQGIYLYTDFALSKWWIQTKIEKLLLNEEPAVIEVVCKDNIKVLNLDNFEGMNFFYSSFEKVFEELKTLNVTVKLKNDSSRESKIKNLCFALDLIKKKYDIGVVIYTFTKTNPSYGEFDSKKFESEYFPFGLSYKETQVCISNNKCIGSKKCVYPIREYKYNRIENKVMIKKRGRLI